MADNADDSTSALDPAYFETKIPVEILHRIFELSLPYTSRGAVAVPPWHLAQLSRRTREVALCSPRLWSDIRVDGWDRLCKGSAGQARIHTRLLAQLQRSGSHPLRIFFRCLPYDDDAVDAALLLRLCVESHRWLEASIDAHASLVPVLLRASGNLPQLRYLALRVPSGDRHLHHPDHATIFFDAPNLGELNIAGHPHSRQFPFVHAFHDLACLGIDWTPDIYSDVFPIRLISAALLNVSILRAPGIEFLLTASLPALHHLVLPSADQHRDSVLTQFYESCPGVALEALFIMQGSWEALWLLDAAPTVTHLGLGVRNSDALLLASLIPPPPTTAVAKPFLMGDKLTALTIFIDEMIGEGAFALGHVLLEMVRGRRNSPFCTPLTHLAITSHALRAADICALREIEGLDLWLVSFRHSLPPACDLPRWALAPRMRPWGGWQVTQPTAYSNACMTLDWMRSSLA
ncbi:hypothetical protein C8R44DRAFT_987466 [Mycena epipterygia]|nr:hypothetical protein C8R44DRAFT_987466 [Mycena epipterygia]